MAIKNQIAHMENRNLLPREIRSTQKLWLQRFIASSPIHRILLLTMTKREEMLRIMIALITTGRHYYPEQLADETTRIWKEFNRTFTNDKGQ
jgi:hypothetical protein